MAVYVTDNCDGCRYTECVRVCPVACFHGDEKMLYVDNSCCIDCFACIPACPVQAIHEVLDPDDERELLDLNKERSQALPVISIKRSPLPSAAVRQAELGF